MSLWASILSSLHIFMMSTYASGSRIYLRWAVIESFKFIWGQFAIPVYGQKICEILFCDLCVERWDKLHQKRSITFLTYDDWRTIQDLKNIVRKVLLVFLLCLSLRYFYVNCSFCLAFNKCNVRLAINESHLHPSKSFLEKMKKLNRNSYMKSDIREQILEIKNWILISILVHHGSLFIII